MFIKKKRKFLGVHDEKTDDLTKSHVEKLVAQSLKVLLFLKGCFLLFVLF